MKWDILSMSILGKARGATFVGQIQLERLWL